MSRHTMACVACGEGRMTVEFTYEAGTWGTYETPPEPPEVEVSEMSCTACGVTVDWLDEEDGGDDHYEELLERLDEDWADQMEAAMDEAADAKREAY